VNDLHGPNKNRPLCYCRSRAFLAAEAIQEYLDINEWQVAGIVGAIASLERGKGIPHERVKQWLASWNRKERRTTIAE
jgi:predicted transcriptional regulator